MSDASDRTGPPLPDLDPDDVAARALDKLRAFIATLDDDERAVMAALLAPGVASAYDEEPEVVGFSAEVAAPGVGWRPERLSDALSAQVRDRHLRIEHD
jgi:hypothetical protein